MTATSRGVLYVETAILASMKGCHRSDSDPVELHGGVMRSGASMKGCHRSDSDHLREARIHQQRGASMKGCHRSDSDSMAIPYDVRLVERLNERLPP